VAGLAALAGVGATLLVLAGCSRSPEVAEVSGTITLDGQPMPDVEVVFLPDPEKGNQGSSASAYTDARGHYQLHCEAAGNNGAGRSTHRVCLHDIAALPQPESKLTPAGRRKKLDPTLLSRKGKPSRLPPEYNTAARTPIRNVEIKPGKQTLDFDVKTVTK
jgi:hypothetical protein